MDRSGFANFLLGLGVGIGIGMLFAPKTGEQTRELIKNKAGEGKDYLKQRSAGLRESAGGLVDKGKDVLGRQRDTLSEAMQAGRQAYRETVGEQRPAEGTAQ
jgi:gas vesicle protein